VRIIEGILRNERALTATCLVVVALLAWLYVWHGAEMGMSALDMTVLTLFPHAHPEPMPGMAPPTTTAITLVAMWWVMMVAMMAPSAAPLILLYGRVMRNAAATRAGSPPNASSLTPSYLLLLAGYFIAWLGFSAIAAVLQSLLERAQLISPMMFWSKSAALSAAVLIGAGVYQLSPLKRACLKHCRGPVSFLIRRPRTGKLGALTLGLEHGAWCIGCCWMLMALLFVGGVMNVVWIALLGLLVLAEKIAPQPAVISTATGVLLIAWGVATLAL
jgi:predicted metal-binding membrane protein